jgi:hypothetical protein
VVEKSVVGQMCGVGSAFEDQDWRSLKINLKRSPLFWDVTQRILVASYRSFGTPHRSYLPRLFRNMTSNYAAYIPAERRYRVHCGGSGEFGAERLVFCVRSHRQTWAFASAWSCVPPAFLKTALTYITCLCIACDPHNKQRSYWLNSNRLLFVMESQYVFCEYIGSLSEWHHPHCVIRSW